MYFPWRDKVQTNNSQQAHTSRERETERETEREREVAFNRYIAFVPAGVTEQGASPYSNNIGGQSPQCWPLLWVGFTAGMWIGK